MIRAHTEERCGHAENMSSCITKNLSVTFAQRPQPQKKIIQKCFGSRSIRI